ncbi:Whirlin [Holothuria leucospilota]|uniref:Whirlin n=1 Tax=Holothuria leucospilota TaxID=206669 RepID=A0A9Q1C586_HOLLE|nr:Whirlin [Holothuria leucospilota]
MMSVHHPIAPPRSSSRISQRSTNSSRSMSTNVRRLHEALSSILTDSERGSFVKALNDYHSKRNVHLLVKSLAPLLDTAEKKQLYQLLRKVIPSTDQATFWQYAQSLMNTRNSSDRSLYQEHGPRHPTETLPVRVHSKLPPQMQNNSFSHDPRATQNGRTVEPFGKTIKTVTGPPPSPFELNQDVRKIVLNKEASASLGFSIRGGSEHSVGIFVTQVEPGGYAERKGLMAGDQIVAVNEIPFDDMSHAEAVMVLKAARRLVLYVKSVGRVPGSFQSVQTYTWVDPQGRSVSPPPDADPLLLRQAQKNGHKSAVNLLKSGDEQKVTLVVEDGESLGLMIRGGREFDLGIYVTGVDPYSVAEHCGLKVGDQIIDVNNQSFLSIEHQEAVAILKSSKVMMMTIRDVRKLPYARTTVDRTQWLTEDGVSRRPDSSNRVQEEDSSDDENESLLSDEKPLFSKGIAGSQMMYSSMMKTQGWSMIEEQARYFLNENERGTMMFYLKEYQNKNINVDALVLGLFEILNTHSKFSLLSEIRSFINARDIDRYDNLVMKKEVEAMKAKQKGLFEMEKDLFFGDSLSTGSHHSSASEDSRPITPPYVPEELPPNLALDFGSSSTPVDHRSNGPKFSPHSVETIPQSAMNHSNLKTVTVDIHHHEGPSTSGLGRTFAGSSLYADSKSPSEDSGVDMALGIGSARSRTSSIVSPRLTVNTSVTKYKASTSLSPNSPGDGKRLNSKAQRRLSLDSVSTEGSCPTSPLESIQRLHIESDQSIPRRISDPTHHVPRDQKKNVAQTKKASEQLYELRRRSNELVTSPTNSNKTSPPRSSDETRNSDDDYDLMKEISPKQNDEESKTILDSILMKSKQQLLDDLQHMPVDENANEKPSQMLNSTLKDDRNHQWGSGKQRRSRYAVSEHDSISEFNQSSSSHKSSRSASPAVSGRTTPVVPKDSLTARLQKTPPTSMPQLESHKSWEFVDISLNPPVHSILIEMKKSRPNLGIAVEGGAGTRQPLPKIIKIQPGGSAQVSSRLEVGHVIVSVNGRDMRRLNHQQATRIIAEEFKNKKVQSLEFLVVDSNKYKILY